MAVKGWIEGDESAKEMVSRLLLAHTSFSLLPPSFHNLPLRLGNVVEIVGPSPSAKTHILIQAAINSILPKEWDGVHYGGLEQLVIFIDLDCRFDILRLSQLLRIRILQANNNWNKSNATSFDQNLYAMCMRRFLYTRCYDSLEFLATLKTLHYKLQKEKEAQGISGCVLMVDSIGAFHWVDRASTSLQQGGNIRKGLSLQNVFTIVVQEIKKLLLLHPFLVVTTKATILGGRSAANDGKIDHIRLLSVDDSVLSNITKDMQQLPYREYMPSIWQSFITHRIFIQATDDFISAKEGQSRSLFTLRWLLPLLSFEDHFIVKDDGICSAS